MHGTWTDCPPLFHVWRKLHAAGEGIFVEAGALASWPPPIRPPALHDCAPRVPRAAGANIGACSLFMAARNITTVSFEPSTANLHYLSRTLDHPHNRAAGISARVTLYAIGLGRKEQILLANAPTGNAGDTILSGANNAQLNCS